MIRLILRLTAFLLAFILSIVSVSLSQFEFYSTQNVQADAPLLPLEVPKTIDIDAPPHLAEVKIIYVDAQLHRENAIVCPIMRIKRQK